MQIIVCDNNVDQALRVLTKKLQREGICRELKLRNIMRNPRRSVPVSMLPLSVCEKG